MDTHDPSALVAQTLQHLAQTYRLGLRLERVALAMLGLGVVGIGWLIWATWGLIATSDAHTQALLDLLRSTR